MKGESKMNFYIALNRDEIRERIPYALVAETMSSSIWGTGRRKRLMKEYFTKSETEAIYRLHKQAYTWHLRTGVPDEVKMSVQTYYLWQKLANFCCTI